MQSAALVLILCLAALLQTSVALRCYACDTRTTPTCGNSFTANDSLASECTVEIGKETLRIAGGAAEHFFGGERKGKPEGKQMCTKYVLENGEVHRSCGLGAEVDWCGSIRKAHNAGDGFTCVACTDDLCNAGNTFHAASGIVLAAFSIFMGRYM